MRRRRFLPLLPAAAFPLSAATSALSSNATVLINRQPSFPLALYQLPPAASRADALAAARDAGISVVHSAPTRQSLDEIAAHNLHAWCTVGSNPPRITELVTALRDHPALAWWETEDEPSYQYNKPGPRIPPQKIREAYALIRRLDPSRLVYLNHAPTNLVSTLQAYNPGGDLIATDIYPIIPNGIRPQFALWPDGRQGDLLNPYLSQTGQYARKMREVAGPQRALFLVLQAFAWEMLRKENDRDPRMILYPTADQLRFMSTHALIHGVNGLIWWGLQYSPASSGLWSNLSTITRLLRSLDSFLLAPTRQLPLRLEYHDTGHSLDRGLEHVGKGASSPFLFLAANADPNPIDVTLHGLPGNLQVLAGPSPAGNRLQLPPFGSFIAKCTN